MAKKKSRLEQWWKPEKDQAHKEIYDTVKSIHNSTRERIDRNLRCLRLYGNYDVLNFGPSSYLNVSTVPTLPENRVRINIISSMIDTVGSKISKMKPKVTFLTSGGNYSSQKQAKQLNKFMLGAFYMNDVHRLHQEGFRDGEIMDCGAIKHYTLGNRIHSERVLPFELYVDPLDSVYGAPRSLFQVKYVARSVLKAMFKDAESLIQSSKELVDDATVNEQFIEEFVCVIEAWHLPSGKKVKDGRHVICLPNGTLLDESWDKDYFPFTFFKWSKPVVGFWGQSLADRLTSTQVEINKMLRVIQRSFHLGSAFKVFLEYGSKVSKEHINNDIGSIIYYLGRPPEFYTPSVVHSEYFQHLRFLIQSAYEEAGISQLSAGSRKPEGLESGKALREYNDIESERFALVAQDYEKSFLETARIYVDLANDIGDKYKVTAQSKTFIESIEWKDVKPADNAFIMQMFPTSMLPHEPHGRLAFVQELINSGMVSADEGLELLDFPDTEGFLSIKKAALQDLLATMEELADGEYSPPEPFQDLQNGIPMMQSAYLRFKRENLEDDRLENFRRWIAAADALIEKAKSANTAAGPNVAMPVDMSQQAQAAGGAQAPQPGAMPGMPMANMVPMGVMAGPAAGTPISQVPAAPMMGQ